MNGINIYVVNLLQNPGFYIPLTIVIIFSICCHEFMHAWVAKCYGDMTAEQAGYLTLNPLKQMGVFSLICLLIMGIAWGQVPVNFSNLSRKKGILVFVSGPATNFILALLFGFSIFISIKFKFVENGSLMVILLFHACVYNFVLAIFNLMPLPGLDGAGIVKLLFPEANNAKQTEFRNGISFLLLALVFICFKYFYKVAAFLASMELEFLLRLFCDV